MRILLVITGLGVGGAERQVVDLADTFARLGHRVRIVYLTGEAKVQPASSDIPVESLEVSNTPAGLLKAVWRLKKVVNEFAPDVVHSHMVHANLLARITRLFQPMRRLVCTAHSNNEGGRLRMLAYRCTDFLADLSTNVSDAAVRDFIETGASKAGRMVTVYNGIDISRFRPAALDEARESRPLRLLAVGRFQPEKDYACMMKAVDILKHNPSVPDFVLEIAGEGPERPLIEEMVYARGLEGCVQFLGVRADIPRLMQKADIFALSSAWEGFGLVVAEAMACEKVVVATDCGGVREVLDGHGYLVPPRSPDALAEALKNALSMDATDAKQMGKAARRHIENTFGLEAVAARWLTIYAGAK